MHNFVAVSGPTVEDRVEQAADYIKRAVMQMRPGDKLVIERHSEKLPADALITMKEIIHGDRNAN